MDFTAVGGNNAGLNTPATKFARSAVVELINRAHLDVCQQERRIPPNIDLNMRLIRFPPDIVCKSAASDQGGQQENYKFVIQSANLLIRNKKVTIKAHKALIDLLLTKNMVHHLSRVQVKHLSIPVNQFSINFDNVLTGALLDLVEDGLVINNDLAGSYQRNQFNY